MWDRVVNGVNTDWPSKSSIVYKSKASGLRDENVCVFKLKAQGP